MANFIRAGVLLSDTLTELIGMHAACTAARFDTFETTQGSEYQVPAGKELRITKILYAATTALSRVSVGYGDTIVDDSVSAPTNPFTVMGDVYALVSHEMYEFDVNILIPASKYPYIIGNTGNFSMHAIGIEI